MKALLIYHVVKMLLGFPQIIDYIIKIIDGILHRGNAVLQLIAGLINLLLRCEGFVSLILLVEGAL